MNITNIDVEKQSTKRIKVTYYPKTTNQIKNIFKKYNIQLVNSSQGKLKNLLGKPKCKTENTKKSGIYKLSCTACNVVYVDKTSRTLEITLKDHMSDVKYKQEKSAFCKHVSTENNRMGRGARRKKLHEIEKISLLKEVNGYQQLMV